MKPLSLNDAEFFRQGHSSPQTFIKIGLSYGFSEHICYENLSDLVDEFGYRELELADTDVLLTFWESFQDALLDKNFGKKFQLVPTTL